MKFLTSDLCLLSWVLEETLSVNFTFFLNHIYLFNHACLSKGHQLPERQSTAWVCLVTRRPPVGVLARGLPRLYGTS